VPAGSRLDAVRTKDAVYMDNRCPNLKVNIGSLELRNPVMTASGTFGYGREFEPFVDLERLGAIVVKGLSLEPAKGNPPPRIVETASGMLNAIGLENIGVDAFEEEKLPFLKRLDVPVIANIYGRTVDEYVKMVQAVDRIDGIAGIEVNISCPNVKAGGMEFGTDPGSAYRLVKAARCHTEMPLIVKLSPNVTDISEIALQVEKAGADAVSLINTLAGMAIDAKTGRPRLANVIGGLSGPAIKPIALRMVWETAQRVDIPVIGVGGIMTAEDALEFLIAGATAVQIGTANFINPRATIEIIDGIDAFMDKMGLADLSQIVGSLEVMRP